MSEPVLSVKDLKVSFQTEEGKAIAIDGMNYDLKRGETLGIVGESGCGKTVSSLAIMGLLQSPPAKIEAGEIIFHGENLIHKNDDEMRRIRGKQISMIFQEPMTSLNPLYTIGNQVSEVIKLHSSLDKEKAIHKSREMLDLVGIPDPDKCLNNYPHELSGGMRQRVMIAMSLACNPEILIADEPTTALDVTIQAQILDLMSELQRKFNTSIVLITHDLGVIAEMAHRVMVMYAGNVCEYSNVNPLFDNPLHPYTEGLLESIPFLDDKKPILNPIKGSVPSPFNMPKGCVFNPRCPYAKEICKSFVPELYSYDNRSVRCFKYSKQWQEGR